MQTVNKIKGLLFLAVTIWMIISPGELHITKAETTSNATSNTTDLSATENDVNNQPGELHAFYPAMVSFSDIMKTYIDELDSMSVAWSRFDTLDLGALNTVKGKNNNFGFYYPTDYPEVVEYAKEQGVKVNLSIYMDNKDTIKLLPYNELQEKMIQSIITAIQTDIDQGKGIYFDGVVIDFEGLRDTSSNKTPLYYEGEQISTYFIQFLKQLQPQLATIGKNLYVAVSPRIDYDGYDYKEILKIADKVILMAHDYETNSPITKSQVLHFTSYDYLNPIDSLAPINKIRMALNDMQSAADSTSDLKKVILQLCFDSAQWQFDLKSAKEWDSLEEATLSKSNRSIPTYTKIKARVDNTDGYGENITYGYNKELQSPYIKYYNTKDQTWNLILYEDSNSITAKMDLASYYNLGGISVWSLGNISNYNDESGIIYSLNDWDTILSNMATFTSLPNGADTNVLFTDAAVEQSVRSKLGKTSGNLTLFDIKSIYRLKLADGVKSLVDLKKLVNLEYLNIQNQGLKKINELKYLPNLKVLSLKNNQISDLSPLANLINLEVLIVDVNKVSDLQPLAKLTKLQELYLPENEITSITPLIKLTKLKVLSLNRNSITSLKALTKLTSLQKLYLMNNKITTIASLKNLKNLKVLYLAGNKITDYSPVKAQYEKVGFQCDIK
ncbi:MAG: leucine-rich repeat protein [Herbinix sp.]|jgi:internalin A|nr:leucine-rich repeat protein [Herbinix sp.]